MQGDASISAESSNLLSDMFFGHNELKTALSSTGKFAIMLSLCSKAQPFLFLKNLSFPLRGR